MENKIKNEEQITTMLKNLGIAPNLRGYDYIKVALNMLQYEPGLIHMVTKRLYPEIADACGTTAGRVERAIRHAVEVSFNAMDPDDIQEYFGKCAKHYNGKVTNSEFLSILAERIRFGKM